MSNKCGSGMGKAGKTMEMVEGHLYRPVPTVPTYLPTYLPAYLPSRLPTHSPTYAPTHLPTYLRTQVYIDNHPPPKKVQERGGYAPKLVLFTCFFLGFPREKFYTPRSVRGGGWKMDGVDKGSSNHPPPV